MEKGTQIRLVEQKDAEVIREIYNHEVRNSTATFDLVERTAKEQEEWLKDYMVYAGRANLYSDWLVFQSECKKKREQEVRVQALKRHNTLTLIKQFITVIGVGIAVIPVLVYGLIFLLKK